MSYRHLLAINTVTGSCSVAISKGTILLTQKKVVADKGYSEIIIPLIEKALSEVRLTIDHLDGFLVCTGPGNYTSLRIATSTVRGLSLACNRPAYGISLFELLAGGVGQKLVLIKGPQEKIYLQKFLNGSPIAPPQLMTLNEIQTTKDFVNFNTVGYQARKVGELLDSKESVDLNEISFEIFVALGLTKLNSTSLKPAPIYIK
jgi:tRNA threonylcarbamoyl adenosine modification protein YeaZ